MVLLKVYVTDCFSFAQLKSPVFQHFSNSYTLTDEYNLFIK